VKLNPAETVENSENSRKSKHMARAESGAHQEGYPSVNDAVADENRGDGRTIVYPKS